MDIVSLAWVALMVVFTFSKTPVWILLFLNKKKDDQ